MSLHVKLLAPIAGTVTFTQGINDQTGKTYETQIIASLFANDRSVPSGQYTWQLVNRQVSLGIQLSMNESVDRCCVTGWSQ
jgi:hypothetical protein